MHGELFFASSNDLVGRFDHANGPDTVAIDMTHAHVWDASPVAALTTKYATRGNTVEIIELNKPSVHIHDTLAGQLGVGH